MLDKTVKDNFNKILPVYYYGTEQEAQALNPYMDKAIEKASLNIQRHSMFFNRKELVRYIDDSYFLIGVSFFYKQEYNKARRTFEFVVNEYKDNDIKYDALLWLAKTHTELEKYNRAQSVLDNLQNELDKNPKAPKKVILALPLVKADMYIKQDKFAQAKEPLLDAVYMHQKKLILARSMFILGQIYQMEGEYYSASEYYKQVIKKNPPYEMAFNAAINLATSYDTIYGGSSKSIVKNLKKMLKEDKNKDFRDQIYFALADVASKDRQDTLAIHYLALSVASSKTNNYQKTTSSLELAYTYFEIPEYHLSQAYYDTAVQSLPKDYPNSEEITARAAYLTELVDNLIVVETEDSLQRVALMPEEDRVALINKMIDEIIEEEERQKELDELMALNAESSFANSINPASGPIGSGGWYFYNTTAISNGLSEYKKKWGIRKLEDNWFLSNKQVLFEEEDDELLALADSTITDSTGAVISISKDPHTVDFYMQNLPFTEEEVVESNAKIEVALYNLGYIYKDKLNNFPISITTFESLTNRFPETEHKLESWYQLYRLNIMLEDYERADYYEKLIVGEYPDSDYARLITDPEYFKQLQAEQNRAITMYNETYEHYQSGHYYTVYSSSSRALKEFKEPIELLAKFEYLRALSLGKIEVVDSLQSALEVMVKKYPNSEVTPMAQNILDYLTGPIDTTSSSSEPEVKFDVSMYNFDPDSKQLFALVVNGQKININPLKVRISDFNMKYYNLDNLSITNILLDKSTHFVMVGNFESKKQAMRYYNALMSNEYVFANLAPEQYSGFVLAQENYPVFYKDKDVEKYLAFFEQNYLNQ